jgi:predicted nucleic acid-binding protein
MSAGEPFFDTNVLLYLLSGDDAKADVVVHPPGEAANATDAGTRPGPPSL